MIWERGIFFVKTDKNSIFVSDTMGCGRNNPFNTVKFPKYYETQRNRDTQLQEYRGGTARVVSAGELFLRNERNGEE